MSLEVLAEKIRHARRLTILTGAGVSAASGIPTFRGPQGLWREFRPEDLATPEAFARDPQVVWEWYAWRREQIAGCQPNDAHRVIAGWANAARQVSVINVEETPASSLMDVAIQGAAEQILPLLNE